jgi:hypothetical protein
VKPDSAAEQAKAAPRMETEASFRTKKKAARERAAFFFSAD